MNLQILYFYALRITYFWDQGFVVRIEYNGIMFKFILFYDTELMTTIVLYTYTKDVYILTRKNVFQIPCINDHTLLNNTSLYTTFYFIHVLLFQKLWFNINNTLHWFFIDRKISFLLNDKWEQWTRVLIKYSIDVLIKIRWTSSKTFHLLIAVFHSTANDLFARGSEAFCPMT